MNHYKLRSKPHPVTGFQWDGKDTADLSNFGCAVLVKETRVTIHTVNGREQIREGDWILKNPLGTFQIRSDKEFKKTFQLDSASDIISDAEIDKVHAYADFGDTAKRDVVNFNLLKIAAGYGIGSTARSILLEHGLIIDEIDVPSKKGQEYLWAVFGEEGV